MTKEVIKLVNGVKITGFNEIEDIFNEIENIEKEYIIMHYMYWVPFVKTNKIKEYRLALEIADFIFPDGVGLLTYIRLIYKKKLKNLNGTDLNPILIDYFNKKKYSIALYGTNSENLNKCKKNLEKKGINIYYAQDGYSKLNFEEIKSNSVLFVGMGSPIQELWVKDNFEKIKEKKLIVVTVGGYFDFEAGYYKRAPKIIIKLKMEWIFRIIDNPGKHFFKYMNNFYFIPYIIIDTIKLRINK